MPRSSKPLLLASSSASPGGKGAVAFKAIRFTLQARFGWSQYVPPPRP